MMGRIVVILLVLAAASLAMKVVAAAIVLLLLAGLIFRTKESLGLLAFGGIIAGFQSYPFITTCIVVVTVAIGLYAKKKEREDYVDDANIPAPGSED